MPSRHYTCYTKSVITKPQNVLVLRDVHCARYVTGGNCKFFGQSELSEASPKYNAEKIKRAIDKRLGFNDEGGDYESMLCFGLTEPQLKLMQSRTAISLSDRVLPWETAGMTGADQVDQSGFPIGLTPKKRADLGLNTIHYGQDVASTRAHEYLTAGSINNALCFLGPSRQMGLFKPDEWSLVPGQGHFGPDARPGDARYVLETDQ